MLVTVYCVFWDLPNDTDLGRQAKELKKCLIFIQLFHYTIYKSDIFLIFINFLKRFQQWYVFMANKFHRLIFSLIISISFLSPCVPAIDAQAAVKKKKVLSTRHKVQPVQQATVRSRPRNNPARHVERKKPSAAAEKLAKLEPAEFRELLSARSAIVLDATTGKALYAHNPDTPGQPASTIKVLTGLIAMQSLNNNDKVPVSGYAADMPRSKVYLRCGKSYCADDLINAVLLASANDASVALAEKVAGNENTFASIMTQKARELGASSTMCKSASGLTREEQCTTARDLAVIFNGAMQDPEFEERIALRTVKTRDGKVLRTHNKALWNVDGAMGGKTGYTLAARQTYVGKFKRGEDELIVALMGSETMWADVGRLVEFGFTQKQKGAHLSLAANTAGAGGLPVASRIAEDRQLAAIETLTNIKKKSKL